MINFKYSKQKKGKENEKKEERKKFSLSKKQWYPFPFDVLNHSRHQKRFRNVSISSEPCSLRAFILFPPLSSSFTSLHSSPANFAQPIQTRRPVDPSQPNLLFIRFYFFSLSFSLQSSCIPFDRRCRFFDRQNVVARRLVFVTRNQPVYPVICTPCTCKYSLIFV